MDKFGCPPSIFINYPLSIIQYAQGFQPKSQETSNNFKALSAETFLQIWIYGDSKTQTILLRITAPPNIG